LSAPHPKLPCASGKHCTSAPCQNDGRLCHVGKLNMGNILRELQG
jgi:hypothetical protein